MIKESLYVLAAFFIPMGCVETFNPEILDAASNRTLVVDGRITDMAVGQHNLNSGKIK